MLDVASDAGAGARLRLVVLYGGRSAEHEVSCVSARHVIAACDPDRYRIEIFGIGTDGRWVDATEVAGALPDGALGLPEPDDLLGGGARAVDPTAAVLTGCTAAPGYSAARAGDSAAGRGDSAARAGESAAARRGATVVWPALHGPMGEDGTIQGFLEVVGVAYVGAGVTGSAAAMDKVLAKTAFAGAGLPQARWLEVSAAALTADRADGRSPQSEAGGRGPRGGAGGQGPGSRAGGVAGTVAAELGWPVYVKPANMGSTIGVSRAADPAELYAALELAGRYDDHLVVEEEIRGRELETGVLGLDPLEVSVVGEIVPSHDFYDFDDKYRSGTAELLVPAPLPDGVAAQIGLLAVDACRALRVDAMARVDFFYDEVAGRLLLNEVNTLPGFTPISMYPRLWAASGIDRTALVDRLVRLAQARHTQRATRRTAR